jgi:citrate synthase
VLRHGDEVAIESASRVRCIGTGTFADGHAQVVGGMTALGIGRDGRLASATPHPGGGEDGDGGDGRGRVFGVEVGEPGAEGVHAVGPLERVAEATELSEGCLAAAAEPRCPGSGLLDAGAEEQTAHALEAGLVGEALEMVPSDDQATLGAVDERQSCFHDLHVVHIPHLDDDLDSWNQVDLHRRYESTNWGDDMNQRGFDNQGMYIDAHDAAMYLGVKLTTIYSYTSKGFLHTVPNTARYGRLYLVDDLARLKTRRDARLGHGPVAAGALRWGEPVLESSITSIEPEGPVYRGKPAHMLASSKTSFEQVSELLWTGTLPDAPPPPPPRLRGRIPTVPLGATHFAAMSMAMAALDAADPHRLASSPANIYPRARAVVRRLAAALALSERRTRVKAAIEAPSTAAAVGIALGMRSLKDVDAINSALILMADHELNASTFGARVAASAGADLYACVMAGLAVASGFRHGGASSHVEMLVSETGRPENARRAIAERARRGETVPGFGHKLYPEGDPRATVLLDIARSVGGKDQRLATLVALIRAMRDAGREPPNVDAALVGLQYALRLPPGSASGIFVVGRSAGWIAHAFEQRASGALLRPRARFVNATASGDPTPSG